MSFLPRHLAVCLLAGLHGSLSAASLTPIAPSWEPSAILNWNPNTDPAAPYNVSQVPLQPRFSPPTAAENSALNAALNVNSHARPKEGRVQALISFNATPQGPQGWPTTRYYAPTTWQYIHELCHWGGSGGPIGVPMAHVTDAAHRNGVPVLGLVFLAPRVYGGTTQRVNDFLQQLPNGSFPVADKMIQAARYFKFDGWFINMETEPPSTPYTQWANSMQAFMKYYKAQAPELRLVWYDSMISSGRISWQNALNSNNRMFLQDTSASTRVSDGMFLNFYWGSSQMTTSLSTAQGLGRNPYDVYAGIDTEGAGDNGKNTFGGDTPIAWSALFPEGQPHRLSLGIYRPEWTFNYASVSPNGTISADIRYWSGQNYDPTDTSIPADSTRTNWHGIAHYIPANSPILSLPFVTNFSLGQSERYMINGALRASGPWTNLSLQDILPTWKWIVTVPSGGTKLSPAFDFSDAYYGGSCLRVSGDLLASSPNVIKLYQMSLPVTAQTNLRMVYKAGAINNSTIQVGLAFEDAPGTIVYSNPAPATSVLNWRTLEFPLGAYAGRKIAFLTLRFASTSNITGYSARIGRIEISNGTTTPTAPTNLVVEAAQRNPDDALGMQVRLKWTPSSSSVLHYNVYYRKDLTPATDNQLTWLGATPNTYFYIGNLKPRDGETSGYIQIEAVAPGFGLSSRLSTASPTITFPSTPVLSGKLSGTIIGSDSSGSNVKERAFDGQLNTYFDASTADGGWAGVDLGSGNSSRVTAIRYCPRNDGNPPNPGDATSNAGRMVGGRFQGANTSDFSNAVTLHTVGFIPEKNVFTTVLIDNTSSFRYLRYLSPNGGRCNVSEIEFHGPSSSSAATFSAAPLRANLDASQDTTARASRSLKLRQRGNKLQVRGRLRDKGRIGKVAVLVDGRRVKVALDSRQDNTLGIWKSSFVPENSVSKIVVRIRNQKGSTSTRVYRISAGG